MERSPKVVVLLATHNGQRFLVEMLESLVNQSYQHWELIVYDDCSEDGTYEVIANFACTEARVRSVIRGTVPLGLPNVFGSLMEEAASSTREKYYAFADQDDVWCTDKIGKLLSKARELEAEGCGPILIHSDLQVVDERMQVKYKSFWRQQWITRCSVEFPQTLRANAVTGCASLVNRTLLEKARPLPPEAVMHDWWLALVASVFGRIGCVPEATVLYRQHDSNSIGSRTAMQKIRRRIRHIGQWDWKFEQAAAFLLRYKNELAVTQLTVLEAFVGLPKARTDQKVITVVRYHLYPGPIMKVREFLRTLHLK